MITELTAFLAHVDNKPATVVTVEQAWGLEPVDNVADLIPALYVYPGDDDSEDAGFDGQVGSMVTQTANVAIVCSITDFEDLKKAVRQALIGWSEGAVYTDLEWQSGSNMGFSKGNIVWWQEVFINQYQIRET